MEPEDAATQTPPAGKGAPPVQAWLIFLAVLGFFGIYLLLGAAPDGGIDDEGETIQCTSVLGTSGSDRGEDCGQERSEQLGWVIVLAIPTIVLGAGGIALTGRRSQA